MDLDIRYAAHPDDVKGYDTATLRRHFLVDSVFSPDQVQLTYSHVDRIIAAVGMRSQAPQSDSTTIAVVGLCPTNITEGIVSSRSQTMSR